MLHTELVVSGRQRLGKMTKYNVDTTLKIIKVYEELKRLLAGRVDFNEFISEVARAFNEKVMNLTYTAFTGITSSTTGLNSTLRSSWYLYRRWFT